MLFAAALIGIGLLVAPYALVQGQISELNAAIKSATTGVNGGKLGDIQGALSAAKARITALAPDQVMVVTDVLSRLIADKPSGITISGISYQRKDVTTVAVNLQGKGVSREAIQQFEQNLKQEKSFAGVDVPVSDFAKASDIDFSLSFTASGQ